MPAPGAGERRSDAPARFALRGDRAAVRHGDAPGDGQAQPDPGVAKLAG